MDRRVLISVVGALALGGCSSPSASLPRLAVTTGSLPGGEVGTAYSATLRATGGDQSYSWSLRTGALPPGLSLDITTGIIAGTPAVDGTFPITVSVRSGDGQTATRDLTLETAWPKLTVTTVELPPAEVGKAYVASLDATGGDGVYVWSLASGELAPGLSLGASGVIEGAAAEAGVSSFTVTVSSGDGQTSAAALALATTGPLEDLTGLIPGGSLGEFYTFSLDASGGDGMIYDWTLVDGALPAGTSLSPDGVISGTPGETGIFSFVARASSAGRQSSTGLTLTVSTAPSAEYNISVHWLAGTLPAVASPTGAPPGPSKAALIDPRVESAMEWAMARWEQAIRADLGSETIAEGGFPASACNGNGSLINGGVFNDLTLLVAVAPIDGPLGTLAQAGACIVRDNLLPVVGVITFDSADVNTELVEVLREIALHEIGHALGFSSSFFQDLSLATGIGTSTPRYIGANGVAQYKTFGGCCNDIALEETGGPGSAYSHWDEFGHGMELMTPQIEGPGNPLSVMTLGALTDLGYTVDFAAGDPYACPTICTPPRERPPGALPTIAIGNDVLPMPRYVVGSGGSILEILQP